MRQGHLSELFSGVVVKRLTAVEVSPSVSNQHEFNASPELRALLGDVDRKKIPARFLWIGQEQEAAEPADGWLSWYDARRRHPTRSEFRLYYPSNEITQIMREGDSFFLAMRSDSTALVIATPTDSTVYNQLLWLFGIEPGGQPGFQFQPVEGRTDSELDFAARSILDALGIEPDESEAGLIDSLVGQFGATMPRPAVLSQMARDSLGFGQAVDDPDAALLGWVERETKLFRRIERNIVAERIESGFKINGAEDVEGFIAFSLSVQNRRKSRAGLALESHLQAILQAQEIEFTRGAITENGNSPDFLFPSIDAYHNSNFPETKLMMLGAKSTLKERWRQVLSEAERITHKHLITLEPGISEQQTREMKAKNLQLVVPHGILQTYKPTQQSWLWTLRDFIGEARRRQS